MLNTKEFENFFKSHYKEKILEETLKDKHEKSPKIFHFDLDYLFLIKNRPQIATMFVGDYQLCLKSI